MLGGGLVLGTGVQVKGVVREVDVYLQERMRSALSDMAQGETQESIFKELESAIGELTKDDLSTSLSNFFGTINDVLNQPDSAAVRHMAVLQGQQLSESIRQLNSRVEDLRKMTNERVVHAAGDMNQLITEIAKLNRQIIEVEQGGMVVSDAVGLRDKRDLALEELARLVNIQVDEQQSGAVNVFVGGDYLVFDGATQLVKVVGEVDRGLSVAELRLTNSDALLRASSGEVAGLVAARDEVLAGFLEDLDTFAGSLVFEFNKLHSSGQGMHGYDEIISEQQIDDASLPLDEAGLSFAPVHGAFQVQVINRDSGLYTTHDIQVQLNGLDDDTTYSDLIAQLDAVDGLSAERMVNGQLRLRAESEDLEFALADDTSGVLAAFGVNTFFTGSNGANIGINKLMLADARLLGISAGGVGHDSQNGERMAQLLDTPVDSQDGATLNQVYEQWMGATSQASALAQAVAEGYRSFHTTLEGEHLALSGVNLDEEAINMITFQRTYQASAKIISTISELLDVLVNL